MTKEAYFNDEGTKQKAIKRAQYHLNAGSIVQEQFGEFKIIEPGTAEFRGCAVGCLATDPKDSIITDGFRDDEELLEWLNSQDIDILELAPILDPGTTQNQDQEVSYEPLEEAFNFSPCLSGLIDAIFENLYPEGAKSWPLEIVKAIKTGTDVSDDRIALIIKENQDVFGPIIFERFGFSDSWHFGITQLLDASSGSDGSIDAIEAADILIRELSE